MPSSNSHDTPDYPVPAISSSARARPGLSVTVFGHSDTGQKREHNEDGFVVAEFARSLTIHQTNIAQPSMASSSHRVNVFLVADGVGGANAGEVASAMSAVAVEDFLLNCLKRLTRLDPGEESDVLSQLRTALTDADARLIQAAAEHPEWGGMGTTMTLAVVVNRQLLVAHAGDSRAYLFSDGKLMQITRDHTLIAEMVQKGLIEPHEGRTHPWRHVISNILGGKTPGVHVELSRLDLHPGDIVLLCSDGLTEMVDDTRIKAILARAADPQTACVELVAEANNLGGVDNITAVVARFAEPIADGK